MEKKDTIVQNVQRRRLKKKEDWVITPVYRGKGGSKVTWVPCVSRSETGIGAFQHHIVHEEICGTCFYQATHAKDLKVTDF